jgi:hypothetical protein
VPQWLGSSYALLSHEVLWMPVRIGEVLVTQHFSAFIAFPYGSFILFTDCNKKKVREYNKNKKLVREYNKNKKLVNKFNEE